MCRECQWSQFGELIASLPSGFADGTEMARNPPGSASIHRLCSLGFARTSTAQKRSFRRGRWFLAIRLRIPAPVVITSPWPKPSPLSQKSRASRLFGRRNPNRVNRLANLFSRANANAAVATTKIAVSHDPLPQPPRTPRSSWQCAANPQAPFPILIRFLVIPVPNI